MFTRCREYRQSEDSGGKKKFGAADFVRLWIGFDTKNLKQIGGAALAAHHVSIYILQKVGLRFIKPFH